MKHVVLVTRRYWPLVGGAERAMASLGEGLKALGFRVTLVTAQWAPDWPAEIMHREIPVIRLAQPRVRAWGTLRYMLGLGRWVHARRREIDGVIVSMLKHDAYAVLTALGGRAPVLLRAEGGGPSGDCCWQQENRFGARIQARCQRASVAAPSKQILAELREAGYPEAATHFVPNGVALPKAPVTSTQRARARAALVEANADLAADTETAVVVYTGRLDRRKGLLDAIDAWPDVLLQRPDARLWLVGEGPDRELLYRRISDLDLRGRVCLPGAFDDIEDVLRAADVFLLPSHEEGMSLSLLEAMAAGLPLVASDIPGNQGLIEHRRHGLLTPPGDAPRLAESVLALLAAPAWGKQIGVAARQRVAERFDLSSMAKRHAELLGLC